jgi:hypothetical protein
MSTLLDRTTPATLAKNSTNIEYPLTEALFKAPGEYLGPALLLCISGGLIQSFNEILPQFLKTASLKAHYLERGLDIAIDESEQQMTNSLLKTLLDLPHDIRRYRALLWALRSSVRCKDADLCVEILSAMPTFEGLTIFDQLFFLCVPLEIAVDERKEVIVELLLNALMNVGTRKKRAQILDGLRGIACSSDIQSSLGETRRERW